MYCISPFSQAVSWGADFVRIRPADAVSAEFSSSPLPSETIRICAYGINICKRQLIFSHRTNLILSNKVIFYSMGKQEHNNIFKRTTTFVLIISGLIATSYELVLLSSKIIYLTTKVCWHTYKLYICIKKNTGRKFLPNCSGELKNKFVNFNKVKEQTWFYALFCEEICPSRVWQNVTEMFFRFRVSLASFTTKWNSY